METDRGPRHRWHYSAMCAVPTIGETATARSARCASVNKRVGERLVPAGLVTDDGSSAPSGTHSDAKSGAQGAGTEVGYWRVLALTSAERFWKDEGRALMRDRALEPECGLLR